MRKPLVFTAKSFNKEAFTGWTFAQLTERYKDQMTPEEIEHAAKLLGIEQSPGVTSKAAVTTPPPGKTGKDKEEGGI